MAYNEVLANRIREKLEDIPDLVEKRMMGGLTFMIDDKMCVGVLKDELMCRIDPDEVDQAVEKRGCRQMDFTGKPMKSYVLIDETGYNSKKDFDYWIDLALEFNPRAISSKKKGGSKR
jgi:TfoX/Sxy family transcriptional regulator of competence genes